MILIGFLPVATLIVFCHSLQLLLNNVNVLI
jgi:hypothetical protein